MNATSRRGALGFSAAALFAGFAAPAPTKPDADAELIALCDQFVAVQTEWFLIMDHDEHVSDFGPNNARYEQLEGEKGRLSALIEECESPATPAGIAAVARAALTWVTLDPEGNFKCDSIFEELLVRVAEAVAIGFVWPPRPGSRSTAHWAPPPTEEQIDEHMAARRAWIASVDAEIKAKELADLAEQRRRQTPALLTDDELRGRLHASQDWAEITSRFHANLTAEAARRGLVA
jgi:hypothetical protein